MPTRTPIKKGDPLPMAHGSGRPATHSPSWGTSRLGDRPGREHPTSQKHPGDPPGIGKRYTRDQPVTSRGPWTPRRHRGHPGGGTGTSRGCPGGTPGTPRGYSGDTPADIPGPLVHPGGTPRTPARTHRGRPGTFRGYHTGVCTMVTLGVGTHLSRSQHDCGDAATHAIQIRMMKGTRKGYVNRSCDVNCYR